MYAPNFLMAMTGSYLRRGDDWQAHAKRRIHPQAAVCLEAAGLVIEVGFVEMLRGEGWR
jgi:hypothetical protein